MTNTHDKLREAELLPCPFCGDGFKIGQEPRNNPVVGGLWYIFHAYGEIGSPARRCPIVVPNHFDTKEEAIAAWNTRALMQPEIDCRVAEEREKLLEKLRTPSEGMIEAANVADRGMLPWKHQWQAMLTAFQQENSDGR